MKISYSDAANLPSIIDSLISGGGSVVIPTGSTGTTTKKTSSSRRSRSRSTDSGTLAAIVVPPVVMFVVCMSLPFVCCWIAFCRKIEFIKGVSRITYEYSNCKRKQSVFEKKDSML